MATRGEVLNWVRSLADRGAGIDIDGAYGMQCVDLPNAVSQKFFGKALWGNGIDMLNACASAGYRVERSGLPRAGAIFCMRVSYHGYGHTGIVVGDPDGNGRFQTVEQNVDGGMGGGPARYRTRVVNGGSEVIIGWAYPPYSDGLSGAPGGSQPSGGGLGSTGGVTDTMDFLFNIKGDPAWNPGTIYYYNGATNEIQGCHNPEELKWLQIVYRETTGRELKSYGWTNSAPVYVRVFGVLRPGMRGVSPDEKNALKMLEELYKKLDAGSR